MPKIIQEAETAVKGWATTHVVIIAVIAFVLGLIVEGVAK